MCPETPTSGVGFRDVQFGRVIDIAHQNIPLDLECTQSDGGGEATRTLGVFLCLHLQAFT